MTKQKNKKKTHRAAKRKARPAPEPEIIEVDVESDVSPEAESFGPDVELDDFDFDLCDQGSFTPTQHRTLVGMYEVPAEEVELLTRLDRDIQRFDNAAAQFKRKSDAAIGAASVARTRRDFEQKEIESAVLEQVAAEDTGVGRLFASYEDGYVFVRRYN